MTLRALRAREASMFACLVETAVAPGEELPPVGRTDAVAAFDRTLAASPRLNRAFLRASLYAVELGPLVRGHGHRMRRLSPDRRTRYVESLEHGTAAQVFAALFALVKIAYYGDDGVMRAFGYDADANVARGRALRAAEARW